MTGMLVVRLLVSIAEAPADQAEVLGVWRGEIGLQLERLKRSYLLLCLQELLGCWPTSARRLIRLLNS